ncbi:MAG: metallophosphoesterase [Lachnospiraceae bacterium]
MRVLIVSDTHRRDENLKKVLEKEGPIDLLIHLGDAEGSEQIFKSWLPDSTRLIVLKGNNDFFSDLETEETVRIGKYNCLLTHGHYYNVSLDLELLRQEARARGFDLAMFGHTHRPVIEEKGGVTLLNPGSLSYPRQVGHKPSYILLESDLRGNIRLQLNFLEE